MHYIVQNNADNSIIHALQPRTNNRQGHPHTLLHAICVKIHTIFLIAYFLHL